MIRPYKKTDKSSLIEIIRLNTPKYFDLSEKKDFENYLEKNAENYFVIEENNCILGGGGISVDKKESTGRLFWAMIHPNHHKRGLGKKLVNYRIKTIKSSNNINIILIKTSQKTFKFYEKLGFQIKRIERNFWGKNLDIYEMELTNF